MNTLSCTDTVESVRIKSPHKTRSMASTALIGDRKSSKFCKLLSRHLKSPTCKTFNNLHPYKQPLQLPSFVKTGKQKKVEELVKAVKATERESNRLEHKINKFEKLFQTLCKSLEDKGGTKYFKTISTKIHKEFNRRHLKKSKSEPHLYLRGLTPNFRKKKLLKEPVHIKLNSVKNRAIRLIQYLKSKH